MYRGIANNHILHVWLIFESTGIAAKEFIYQTTPSLQLFIVCLFSFTHYLTREDDVKKLYFFHITDKLHLSFTVLSNQDIYFTLTLRFQDATLEQWVSYITQPCMFTALRFKNRIMRLARFSRVLKQRKGQRRWSQFVEWKCMHLQNKVIIYIKAITPLGKISASSVQFFPPSFARCNTSLLFSWWWCCCKCVCPDLHLNPLTTKLFYSKPSGNAFA